MEFKVTITKTHIERSSGYKSITNCPLAVALKEIFPNKEVCVGGTAVNIGSIEDIVFDNNLWDHEIYREMRDNVDAKPVQVVFPDFPEDILKLTEL